MKGWSLYWMLPVVLCLSMGVLVAQDAWAGTTGKLTGQITDASSGAPLPGANVVIEGTRRGATADAEGYYLILSVEPGTYKLTASMVGYGAVSKTDVKIAADFTTTVDFQLKEVALEAAELVVTAERPPVEPDKTTSHYVVSSEDIEKLPMTRSVGDLMTLQPGVQLDNPNVIRGGDSQDGALYVDGVRIQNNDVFGRQFRGVNKTAIQEVTVISGGASAEYGNLESGAVSIVTKEGSRNYRGWADYRYTAPGKKHWGENIYESPYQRDHLKWGNEEWTAETVVLGPGADGVEGTPDDEIGLAHRKIDYTDVKGHYIEGGLSGPIGDQVSFLSSLRWTKQPMSVTNAFPSLQTPFDIRGNAKVTFRPMPELKLSVGEIYSTVKGYNGGTNVQRDLSSNGQNIFLPDGSGAGENRITDNVTYVTLTHTINPRTFYEVKLARYSTVQDTLNLPFKQDKFGFPLPTFAEKDLDGWFNVRPAQSVDFTLADRTRWFLKADLSSQVTKGHFIKAGLTFTHFNLYYWRYRSPKASDRRTYTVTTPGHLPDDKAPLHPMQFGIYAQDKMEFEGMVVNAGVRFDAFYTNTHFYNVSMLMSPQWRWLIKHVDMPKIDPNWATVISPRLGVSHPITARSAFHFSAGLYTNLPDFYNFFRQEWRAKGPDEHVAWDAFNGLHALYQMANPYIQYMRTRAYEAGADWNFVADYVAGVSAYYKSAIAKLGWGSRYWYEPQRYTYVWGRKPRDYQDMKGFELSVKKRFSHYFSFDAAINFGWASYAAVGSNATMFYPDSLYVMDPNLYYGWEWDGAKYVKKIWPEEDLKKWGNRVNNWWRGRIRGIDETYEYVIFEHMDIQKAYDAPEKMKGVWQPTYGGGRLYNPKGSDRRTQASLSFYFSTPTDFGPALRAWYFLGGIRANMVWRIQSGPAKWYTPPGRQSELRHKPIRTWTDLEVEKTMASSGSRDAVLYVEVRNLFNQKDSYIPYNYPDYVRWGLNAPRPDDEDYHTYGDYNELNRYVGSPRQVAVGLRANF